MKGESGGKPMDVGSGESPRGGGGRNLLGASKASKII